MTYWDISKVLAYQRNFNFINGPRSIGKTYTTLKYLVKRYVNNGEQFVYICRTKQEKKGGILEQALKKVMSREYHDCVAEYTSEEAVVNGVTMAHCIALSEAAKIKPMSFPWVRWLIFDEYMIEEGVGQRYVNGWREPDSLLSIYHTIDRDEDRVTAFMLGNNTSFYNPYHLHKAFQIQPVPPGGIWTSKNVLYQWAQPSEELKQAKSKSAFGSMIEGTDYGDYATYGQYAYDDYTMIKPRELTSTCAEILRVDSMLIGLWYDRVTGTAVISGRYNNDCKRRWSVTAADITEGYPHFRSCPLFGYYRTLFITGKFYFESIEIKKRFEILVEVLMRGTIR